MSEVLIVAHGDSGVSEYEVASGQLLRVTDPQSHVGIVGHRLQTSEPLADAVGAHGLFLHNKSSLKAALWSSGEVRFCVSRVAHHFYTFQFLIEGLFVV